MSEGETTDKELVGAIENLSIDTNQPEPVNNASNKINILLNATGNVPIMRQRKWAVEQNKTISEIIKFIHNYLKLDTEDKLFLYVNQTFAPSPDQLVKNLFECYGTNGRLILYYCRSQTWG